MAERVQVGKLQIAKEIYQLLDRDVLPILGITSADFWQDYAGILDQFLDRNRELLNIRQSYQEKIDNWHRQNPNCSLPEYKAFLTEIEYLLPEGDDFTIETQNVDTEIAGIAAPQLVVPVNNARFALNAANARWGSLFDALYGTDVIANDGGAAPAKTYNPVRGNKVIAVATEFLDRTFPLANGSHGDVVGYRWDQQLGHLLMDLSSGHIATLKNETQFAGWHQASDHVGILLVHNGLHAEIQVDRSHPVGQSHQAGVRDICLESALTVIQDCEDSVAAVDAKDKALVYGNWLGLIKGDLSETFAKAGKTLTRSLNPDREYRDPTGRAMTLPGRSLLLVRNVGHLMNTDAVLYDGEQTPEGLLDSLVTAAISAIDVRQKGRYRNSRAGSIYVVKPKMHGPQEVLFTVDVFAAVEKMLGLPANTVKIGIMDEERRTTINLKECIRAAKDRVIFINTGFLDRTGDEIHTSMEAGPVVAKGPMKDQPWIQAYEKWNVGVGLECGFRGRAQIGKGMWAKPDEMAEMLRSKMNHPKSGASCAWVPSPTAATLHAIHYHDVDVDHQQGLVAARTPELLDQILTIPLQAPQATLSPLEIQQELDNNVQGILGYVVRWVNQGVGCSKVPDINHVGLMEDRATLRISSQHIANWLYHRLCSREQVEQTLRRMAAIVDQQNQGDPDYRAMSPDFDGSLAFQAASDLIFHGRQQPSGYTEPVLHQRRRQVKQTQ